MVKLIVACHGDAAPGLLATAAMIMGDVSHVTPITFHPGQGPDDLIAAYEKEVAADEPVLLLVDLFGGSPYNAAARFVAERDNADVVAGVNVPMLMDVIGAAKKETATVESLGKRALKAGSSGVRSFKLGKAPAKKPAAAAAEPATPPNAASGEIDPNFPKDPAHTMNCVFMRIDSRLIHGQVAGAWCSEIAPQTLIAASDNAAQDSLRKQLLLQVAPAGITTNVLKIDKTERVYFNPNYEGMKTMIVVENPVDALRLLEAGVKIKELNVGGVTFKEGMVQLSEAVYATAEHIAAYKKIGELGIPMVIQQVPTGGRADMLTRLKEKGL